VVVWVSAEQLLHELEQKYFALQSDFAVCEAERQALATDKQAAGTVSPFSQPLGCLTVF
jgi:hypothetical protein